MGWLVLPAGLLCDGLVGRGGRLLRTMEKRDTSRLISTVSRVYSSQRASALLGDLQRVVCRYLEWTGFSIGSTDCAPDLALAVVAREVAVLRCSRLDRAAELSKRLGPDRTAVQVDAALQRVAEGALTEATALTSELAPAESRLVRLVQSGAKGNAVNVGQVMAYVGQQVVQGQRAGLRERTGFQKRVYPWEPLDPATPWGRSRAGLSRELLRWPVAPGADGLRAGRAGGGREHERKVQTTGYPMRRLVKCTETQVADWSGAVCGVGGAITQPMYGGSAWTSAHMVPAKSHASTWGPVVHFDFGQDPAPIRDQATAWLAAWAWLQWLKLSGVCTSKWDLLGARCRPAWPCRKARVIAAQFRAVVLVSLPAHVLVDTAMSGADYPSLVYQHTRQTRSR